MLYSLKSILHYLIFGRLIRAYNICKMAIYNKITEGKLLYDLFHDIYKIENEMNMYINKIHNDDSSTCEKVSFLLNIEKRIHSIIRILREKYKILLKKNTISIFDNILNTCENREDINLN